MAWLEHCEYVAPDGTPCLHGQPLGSKCYFCNRVVCQDHLHGVAESPDYTLVYNACPECVRAIQEGREQRIMRPVKVYAPAIS